MTKKSLISYVIAVAALYAYSFPVSALPKCPQEGVWHNCIGTFTRPDGAVYEGDWVNGKRTGKGTYTYANGDVSEGDWVNDKRTGKGTYTWSAGYVYEGDWVNSKRTGKGTFTWPDGRVYEGDFVDDKRTGKGTYKSDSYAYEGDFVDGKITGKGTETFFDGAVYEGDFVDGKRTGKGTLTWPEGDVYEGDWVNDRRTGKGTETFFDYGVYEGDFVDGKRTGKGTFTYANGHVYEGDWVNDKRTKGTETLANGDVYEGDFVNGKRTGKGTFTWTDGDVYEGDFVNGEATGQGTLTLPDGRVYEGDFVNGKFSGKNKYIANRNDSEQNDTQTISWGKAHPAIKFIATEPGIGRDLKGDWPETLYMFGSLGYKGQPVPPPWGQGQPIIGVIDAQKISKCSYTAIQKIDVGAHYRYGKVQKTFIDFNKINWKTAGNKYSGDEMTVSYDCKGDCISVYGVHSLPKPPRIGWRSATSISFVFENQNGLWGRGSAALKDIADMCNTSSSDY